MKGFLVIIAIIVSLFVYVGVPYEFWQWLAPVSFWQKAAVTASIAVYEWFTFWLGLISWAGLIALLVAD